jgi:hypothetical protein
MQLISMIISSNSVTFKKLGIDQHIKNSLDENFVSKQVFSCGDDSCKAESTARQDPKLLEKSV